MENNYFQLMGGSDKFEDFLILVMDGFGLKFFLVWYMDLLSHKHYHYYVQKQ